jgi:hypothetical protein
VTLTAEGWSDGQQTAQNSNFAEQGYAYLCGPADGSRSAWNNGNVRAADSITQAGALVFHCDTEPEEAITVNFTRWEAAET